ncbi:MAG: mannose-1-phosphate guanylyltransferase [Christensenellaceae bacterium]|jgi:mannose-1-phosphate guanylyltransferase/mannose-6-phosphate isomerase
MVSSVILAGGSGTRLWPLSDADIPKQFLKLFSEDSMIVETSNRIKKRVPLKNQYVLTGEKYRALAEEEFGSEVNVLCEPCAKNTAPCLLWAAYKIQKDCGGDAAMVVMPSDHAIKDEYSFLIALDTAIEAARDGKIVTFGIVPTWPETGYGYIEIDSMEYTPNRSVMKVAAFREKPDAETAERFIEARNYLWNSGMFIFTAQVIIDEFEKHCPDVWKCFSGIDPDDMDAIAIAFQNTPSISIDYAIMEHTQKAVCVPAVFGWSDVGGFKSLHDESKQDAAGNVIKGDVIAVDTTNCYINGEKRIVCVGLDNLVVVESEHTILVAKNDRSEEIGKIAKQIDAGK